MVQFLQDKTVEPLSGFVCIYFEKKTFFLLDRLLVKLHSLQNDSPSRKLNVSLARGRTIGCRCRRRRRRRFPSPKSEYIKGKLHQQAQKLLLLVNQLFVSFPRKGPPWRRGRRRCRTWSRQSWSWSSCCAPTGESTWTGSPSPPGRSLLPRDLSEIGEERHLDSAQSD